MKFEIQHHQSIDTYQDHQPDASACGEPETEMTCSLALRLWMRLDLLYKEDTKIADNLREVVALLHISIDKKKETRPSHDHAESGQSRNIEVLIGELLLT